MHRVFVYGTLKREEPNHYILENVKGKFIDRATIKGTMYDLGAFPGIRLEGDGTIYGEVFEVEGDGIRPLDRLEGHPTFYCRKPVESSIGPVEVYEITSQCLRGARVIANGVW